MSSKISKFWQYVDDVIDDKIITGNLVKKAVERFVRDYDKKEYIFDYDTGKRIVDFTEKFCHHHKGIYAGKPIVLLPHQWFYFINLFGWKNPETGHRRFTNSYKEVARKNAKTTESAIKGLYLLSKDNEMGAQVFVAATKEAQALIAVNDAACIVQASPKLRSKFNTYKQKEFYYRVIHPESNSFMRAIGRDSDREDGTDPSATIVDEYHAHPDDDLVNVQQSGMLMRAQPLMDRITTAGFNTDGPCYKFRRVCIDVLDGNKVDEQLFAMIFSLDKEEEWEDPEMWIKVNPNLDDPYLRDNVIMPYLKQRVREAKNEGGEKIVDVKTKNFNWWCEAKDVWIPDEKWAKNTHGISKDELLGATCFSGYDLSARHDICAVALLFWEFTKRNLPIVQEDGSVLDMERWIHPILWWYWIPEAKVRQNKERIDYTEWVESGYIHTVPGDTIEWEYLEQVIYDEFPKYQHYSGAYDRYLATNGLIQHLDAQGFTLHDIPQGFASISEPTKEFGTLAINGQFEHFNNPVSRWMNKNTTIIRDSNRNIKIQKIDGNKGNLKIDGIAAAINALAEAMSVEIDGGGRIELW